MATILYARVSTMDQTIDHQRTHAEQAGFEIDEVVADVGVSGVSTKLSERPEGKRLFDKLRCGDTLVVRWVDRLGRNYQDVTDTIRKFMNMGVVVRTVTNSMTFDGATTDPVQQAVRDALIAFMAATAQAQVEATKEAQRVGIAAAVKSGQRYLGRKPSYDRNTFELISGMIDIGTGDSAIARKANVSRQAVIRIRIDRDAANAALARWGM
ncbi:MAG: recombinase [Rhodobacteraceae bacterium]|nr:MAG: recombinase [Paracoccaceae bacterium]